MSVKVIVATGYDVIFSGLIEELSKKGMDVVALVTRDGVNTIFENTLSQWPNINTIELPVTAGEMSIPNGMKNSAEYKEKILTKIEALQKINHDYLIAWGINVLPDEMLDLPNKLALNVHPSELPSYRGGFPFQAQILNDENKMHVSIHKTTGKIDDGHIYSKSSAIEITSSDTMSTLVNKVVPIGAKEVANVISELESGRVLEVIAEKKADANKHAWGIQRLNTRSKSGQIIGSNNGILGFYRIHWDKDSISRIDKACRAFDMMNGPFTSINNIVVNIKQIISLNREKKSVVGQILEYDCKKLVVQALDGLVEVEYESSEDFEKYLSGISFEERVFDLSVSVEAQTGFIKSDRIYKV